MKRSQLKADPAKRAAFIQRGRGGLKRTRPARADWRANNPSPRRSELPGARGWTQRVFTLYGNRCVVCGRRATQAHHAVAKHVILAAQHLTPQERVDLAYDARQGVPVCEHDHMAHEAAFRRIPFEKLPASAVQWAIDHGFRSRIMDRRVYPRQAT